MREALEPEMLKWIEPEMLKWIKERSQRAAMKKVPRKQRQK